MPSRPQAIYDARPLGFPKITILSLQHLFAMFGTTILVPTMVGLPVATTLFFAGMGTLIFHWITKGKVPAFLSSSCSFVAVYLLTKEIGISRGHTPDEALAYACLAIAAASILYFVIALLIRWLGVERILKIFRQCSLPLSSLPSASLLQAQRSSVARPMVTLPLSPCS